jgi:hypothetical protein
VKEISELTCGFIDHGGLYQPLAERLVSANGYKRLIYYDPNAEDSETVNDAVIGDSFPENPRFERTDDFWLHKREIDFFVVPDSKLAGTQLELRSQGFPVWGSARSIFLEQSRETFIRVLQDLGLEVPPFKRLIGIDALAAYLKDKENQIIKISKYRRTMETKKWISWDEDEAWIDMLRVRLGGVKNLMPFLVFEAIDKDAFELGFDTYQIRGRLPKIMLDGYEGKDNAYFAALKPFEEMPEQSRTVIEAFRPVLEKAGHGNFWTMEIRDIVEHFFPIDGTPRGPMPGTGSQCQLYRNLPEIIAAGAEGELVEPEPEGKFAAEVALCKKGFDCMWRSTRVPEELQEWMKLSGICRVNGRSWFPWKYTDDEGIGWLVAIGDTPQEVIDNLLAYKELLPPGVDASTEALVDLLREIHKAEAEGIEFTEQEVPEPESVVTNE